MNPFRGTIYDVVGPTGVAYSMPCLLSMEIFMPRKKKVRQNKQTRKRSVIQYASINRSNPTKAEAHLWDQLKRKMKHWDVKFVSQGPLLGKYIGDFVCYELQIVIEVDGNIHKLKRVRTRDKHRTFELQFYGFKVIRFSNSMVFSNVHYVINLIERLVMREKGMTE